MDYFQASKRSLLKKLRKTFLLPRAFSPPREAEQKKFFGYFFSKK